MPLDPSGSFTTRKRSLLNTSELSWGGSDGESWSDAVASSTGVTITDSGNVKSESQVSINAIVDDYEDGDISEYGGDTGFFDVKHESNTSVSARNGSYVLSAQTDGSNWKAISSTAGLNTYPSPGDTFRVWVWHDTLTSEAANYIRIYFGTQSDTPEPDGYYLTLGKASTAPANLEIEKRSGGRKSLVSGSASVSNSAWYELGVDWASDGTITASLYNTSGSELETISTTDTTFASGGVGGLINASDKYPDAQGYWDYWGIL